MTQQQITTAAEEVEADDFDAMMSAFDLMFHVHECPNHSGAERLAAYAQARQAYATYCGFDDPAAEEVAKDIIEKYAKAADEEGVPIPNAPTSNKVH